MYEIILYRKNIYPMRLEKIFYILQTSLNILNIFIITSHYIYFKQINPV